MLRKRIVVVRVLEACLLFALACSCSAASGSDRTIAQFAHTAWGPKNGVPAPILALAQTSDGYLWVGSGDGLYRFDGVVFERYEPASGGPLPCCAVTALLALPDGDLLIAYAPGAIRRLRNGNVTSFTIINEAAHQQIESFAQDPTGTVWAADGGRLLRLEGQQWTEVGSDWNFRGSNSKALFVDRGGTLWAYADHMLFFLPPRAKRFEPTGISVGGVKQIAQAPNGKLWMADESVRPIPLSGMRHSSDETTIQVSSQAVLFDNDGALWITSFGHGIVRSPVPDLLTGKAGISNSAVESFTAKDGLSDDYVRSILRDREGNIWVGTDNGLDRFHKTNLVPVVLPIMHQYAIAAPEIGGDLLIAGFNSMVRVHAGHAEPVHVPFHQALFSFRSSAGAIWWICPDAIYLYESGSYRRIAPPWVPKFDPPRTAAATVDGSGVLWLWGERQGLFYREKGAWHRVELAPEFSHLTPWTAFTDWTGRSWFGFLGSKVLLATDKDTHVVSIAGESPVGSTLWIRGQGHHLWLAGTLGLAFFDGSRFRRIPPADAETFSLVLAVEETSHGDLWLAENARVIEISASEIQQALADPSYRVKYRSFDSSDGFPGKLIGSMLNSIETLGKDGRLWFIGSTGLAWIDTAHIFSNAIAPPVSIRSIKANGTLSASLTNIVLPPRTTNLQITYTALSLSVPEKVRFRYKLEGVDKDWQDAGNRREAFYNRLGPGNYHFQVLACNNDGVWNNVGSTLNFKIAPAWFQTVWFQAFCGCVFLFLLWLLYQVRVKQLRRQFAIGLEARVNERTRIARELHDTLLQDFHGLMFQFQAVHNLIGRRPEAAMQSLNEALADTKKALATSRDAIQGLRTEPFAGGNIAEFLKATSEELAYSGEEDRELPKFHLIEEGERLPLSQTIGEEVCRVALEILRNAYQHAHAHHIEAELRYGLETFRLRVRDDGRGVDAEVLKEGGRPGHWELRGVRERAERIGAHVDFWSEAGAGTEVQIEVPGSIAYDKPPDAAWSRLVRKVRNRGRTS